MATPAAAAAAGAAAPSSSLDDLFVHPSTLACAIGQRNTTSTSSSNSSSSSPCIPCLYKLFPSGVVPSTTTEISGEHQLKLPPNQRPELCPRAAPSSSYQGLYVRHNRILTLGDGDFSFSLSIAHGLYESSCSGDDSGRGKETAENHTSGSSRSSSSSSTTCHNLTATSHESLAQLHLTYEAVGITDKLQELRDRGVTVLHEVDATNLAGEKQHHTFYHTQKHC